MAPCLRDILAQIEARPLPFNGTPQQATPAPEPAQLPKRAPDPISDLPKDVLDARARPMHGRPGLTIGQHLDEFDNWKDCNGNSFDTLVYMNLHNMRPPNGFTSKMEIPEPRSAPKAKPDAPKHSFNNAILDRVVNSVKKPDPVSPVAKTFAPSPLSRQVLPDEENDSPSNPKKRRHKDEDGAVKVAKRKTQAKSDAAAAERVPRSKGGRKQPGQNSKSKMDRR